MKRIILAAIALLGAATVSAQITEVVTATLQQPDGSSTIYYTRTAFKQAYEAALEGAVITLSSGDFDAPDRILKKLKVYGQGYLPDNENNVPATRVVGFLRISSNNASDEPTSDVYLEGIRVTSSINLSEAGTKNVMIVKCRADNIHLYGIVEDITVRQSAFGGIDGRGYVANNFVVENTWANSIKGFAAESSVAIDHSMMNIFQSGPYYYTNCITWDYNEPEGITMYNCIVQRGTTANCTRVDCWTNFGGGYSSLFTDGTDCNWGDNRTWELTDPDSFIGNDGTQIGLLGGKYPFDKIPNIPRILNSTIDTKTSEQGVLNVSISAEARPVVE